MFISILIFIFTLLVLVLIHELGHFLMAKRFGIKVEEFGFGIPPKVFGKKIGETIYSINALPLGGFVRLLGEDEVGSSKSSRDFRAKSVYQRIMVVVAGVVMNLFLAWVIFYSVLIYQDFKIVYPTLEPAVFIGYLEKDFPAAKAGIKVGDRILKVDNKSIKNFEDARNFIKEKKGEHVALEVSDIDGRNIRILSVTPKKVEEDDFLIGVGFSPLAIKQYETFPQKIFSGVTYSFDLTKVTFLGFNKLIKDLTGGDFKTASQSVSGPVGLASVSNDILSGGKQVLPFYFWFIGVISLTLSIFNVLPIPALDGGRLLFLIIEAVSRKKIREDIERKVHQIGFALLLFLALLITYSDISKLIR
ncbi:site-2 protease family protein [Candidatus Daviesbacteria bacterium]|nr:site-2 protease family protein [Candidatus Daviesbacteria bacterium]